MVAAIFMNLGLSRIDVLDIAGLTKNQLYYKSTGNKPGKRPTMRTLWKDNETGQTVWKANEDVVKQIVIIRRDPDLPNYYKLICAWLQLDGWYINHKKVYRLEKEYGLLAKAKKKTGRNFVTFRRAVPVGPLRIIEMDIKHVWISGHSGYGYILTVIDTFTRYVLHWTAGYGMKQSQVKQAWGVIITKYLQPADMLNSKIDIEVRNDNGKQFASNMIQRYFETNHLDQVFTHPYSPEENGHIESFHKTLSDAMGKDKFDDLATLELRLQRFYKTYNNERPHGSIARISPMMFWALWEDGQIEIKKMDNKRARFKLLIERQDILKHKEINRYLYT